MVAQRAASARIRLLFGGNMKVGDLVHAPRYPYWGMGMIVDREEETDGMICVCWFGCSSTRASEDWHDIDYLEIL